MGYTEEILRKYQRVYAKVDLDAICANMDNMKANMASETQLIAVIKTDGYGHGSIPIAKQLETKDYLFGYAVATAEEAHILRMAEIQKPILVLGYTFPYAYEQLAREEVRPAVFRNDSLALLNEAAKKVGKKLPIHIKVDTGMGRIGIRPDDGGIAFVKEAMAQEWLEIEGIFTHFSRADELDKTHTMKQLAEFTSFVEKLEQQLKLYIPYKHCSNSAGIMEIPKANMNIARAGITMYGLYPSSEVDKEAVLLTPSLSLYSHIVYVKKVRSGESVSYGGTYTAKEDRMIATVPVGYGDGYPRSLSNKGQVLICGKRAPIVGRICMDQFMVDITDIPGVKEGDKVTLIGYDKTEHISAEELGDLSGRFNYELVCDLGKRIPRVYYKEGKIVGTKDYCEDYL